MPEQHVLMRVFSGSRVLCFDPGPVMTEHNSVNPYSLFQDDPVLLRLLCNHHLMENNEKASVFFFCIFLCFFYGSQVLLISLCFYFFCSMPLVWISSLI